MMSYPASKSILESNRHYLPDGVASINRLAEPHIAFTKAIGPYLWDADGNEYIDYQ